MNAELQGWIALQTNLEDFANTEFPEDTIQGILPANEIVILTGDPKAGKSLIAIHWAHAVATGTDWLGHKVTQGGVAWLNPDGEHPKFLWERFNALAEYSGTKIDYQTTFATIQQFQISNEQHRENLLAGVRSGISLVIIDTLAAAAGTANLSNQNEVFPINQFTKEVIMAAGEQGVTIVWLHHTTKTNNRGISGSQQILANVSRHFSVTKKGDKITLRVEANRHGEADTEIPLAIKAVDLENGRTVPVIVQSDHKNSKTTPRVRNALAEMSRMSDYEPGKEFAKAALVREFDSLGIPKTGAYNAIRAALEDGLLLEHSNGNSKALSFPVSQNFPNRNLGSSPELFPTSPESLDSGIGKKGNSQDEEIL